MSFEQGVNSYGTIDELDEYWQARPHAPESAAWEGTALPEKQGAAIEATVYLDGTYRWTGVHPGTSQPLGWPRINAYDDEGRLLEGIPKRVIDAQAELAVKALTERLVPDISREDLLKMARIGPLAVEFESHAPSVPRYEFISRILRGLFRGGRNSIPLERV